MTGDILKIIYITAKKTYSTLSFDNGEKLVVSANYPKEKNLSAFSEIDFEQCLSENLTFHLQFGMDSALNYLSYCDRTEEQIRNFLKKKNIPNEIIEAIMLKLKSYHYADDERYATLYTESAKLSTKGKRLIAAKLKQKGIDDDTITTALEHYSEDDERSSAQEWIDRQYRSLSQYPPSLRKEKIMKQLIAKGYPHALIFDILQSYDDDNSEYTAYYEKLIDKKLLLLKAKGLSEQIIKQKLMAHFRPKGAPSELICERIQKILH